MENCQKCEFALLPVLNFDFDTALFFSYDHPVFIVIDTQQHHNKWLIQNVLITFI